MASVAVAFLCLLSVLGAFETAFGVLLNTRYVGRLIGVEEISENGIHYYSYKGLRYAAPPVGSLRFKEPWRGWPIPAHTYVNASDFAPACLQIFRNPPTLRGSEDCLFLNVYTPSAPQAESKPYPVLVFIHGGAFTYGNGRASPTRLVSRGIVVVTIQYRLGVLGFLSSGEQDIPGNFGLLDQQLALKWVQDNIEDFGGDRNRVTLAGASAGGASTTLHMVSTQSRLSFKQAIATSGVFLNPWVLHIGDPSKVRAVARSVGCPSSHDTPVAEVLQCLQSVDANRLVETQLQFQGWHENPIAPFGPVIDGTFITQDPFKSMIERRVARVPMLLSCTAAEGNYIVAEFMENNTALAELDRNWMQIAPQLLNYEESSPTQKDKDFTSTSVRSHYFRNASITATSVPQLIKLGGDRLFVAGIDYYAKTLASTLGSLPVYLYQYAYKGQFSMSQAWSNSEINSGPAHMDDIAQILPGNYSLPPLLTENDKNMARSLVDIWEAFIKTGVPTTTNFLKWDPVPKTGDKLTFLNITLFDAGASVTVPELGLSSFWRKLPLQESGFLQQ